MKYQITHQDKDDARDRVHMNLGDKATKKDWIDEVELIRFQKQEELDAAPTVKLILEFLKNIGAHMNGTGTIDMKELDAQFKVIQEALKTNDEGAMRYLAYHNCDRHAEQIINIFDKQ